MAEKYLLSWEEAVEAGTPIGGGKGWNLGRLDRYGFSIPAGGVLSASVYRLFLQDNNLLEKTRTVAAARAEEVAEPKVTDALDDLRASITKGRLSEFIERELEVFLSCNALDKTSVAIRSSATCEDSKETSFAGIHSSFLNVIGYDKIVEAILGCYASLWTPQALAYRRKMGFSDEEVAAAVVIMQMVPAVSAGVAFSCDPRTGRQDVITISANFGLGESVVSGHVEPDEYTIDINVFPLKVIDKRIGKKSIVVTLKEGGGTLTKELESAEGGKVVLTDAQLGELAYLIYRIFYALGEGFQHQDVEWAFDGERFAVLQARPVTKLPAYTFTPIAHLPVIWSNANLKDALPGVQSTLGWSGAGGAIDKVMTCSITTTGYNIPEGMAFVRLYKGRPYFNLTALQWGYYDSMGMLPSELNNGLGGHQPEIPIPDPYPLKGKEGLKRLERKMRFAFHLLRMQAQAKGTFRRAWETCEAWCEKDYSNLSNEDIIAKLWELASYYEDYIPTFTILGLGSTMPLEWLRRELKRYFPGQEIALANALMAGGSGITSAEHGYELLKLAKTAQSDKEALCFFTAEDFRPLAWRERLPLSSSKTPNFRSHFEEFLKRYGHRGVYEVDITNLRWREDPTYLLEVIRNQILHPIEVDYEETQRVKRERAQQKMKEKLGLKPSRFKINYLAKKSVKSAAMREMAKSIAVKFIEPYRLMYDEVGARLVNRGILVERADVYHGAWIELVSILNGSWDGRGLRLLVEERKKKYEEYKRLDPPNVIIDDIPQPRTAVQEVSGEVFEGLGVAAGQATGAARLIDHPKEGYLLQPGEILVAPSTDPGWTPLFLRASGLIMEVGGSFSHGAIVAREYGIPAVVNVPGAMKALRDGETVTVDGDEGKVYRSGPPLSVSG